VVSKVAADSENAFYTVDSYMVGEKGQWIQALPTVLFAGPKVMKLEHLVEEALYAMVLNYPFKMASFIPIERVETKGEK
jgi:hypothetical protein